MISNGKICSEIKDHGRARQSREYGGPGPYLLSVCVILEPVYITWRCAMDAKILTTFIFSATLSLSACGFKSDLFMPESKDNSQLFTPDATLEVKSAEQIALELAMPADAETAETVSTDEIMIEKVTTEASDASILLTPTEVGVATQEGIPVDLSDLDDLLKKKRVTQ